MIERLYRSMLRIRRVEEAVARAYPSDKIRSPIHLSIGQEAASVGVCDALRPDDIVFGTYRGHAMYLAKGGDLNAMVAEMFGKIHGCARGKGGSMHLVDPEAGVMGASAVVASTIPNAVGYAYALKLRRSDRIVVAFFGDGATEEGVFSESLNFAALKRLPILFVCENNRYAIHTHQTHRQALPDIRGKAAAQGVPAETIHGNDVVQLFERSRAIVASLREGRGPAFIEMMTYRWQEHVGPATDFHLGYRDPAEAKEWVEGDPLATLADRIDASKRQRMEEEVAAEIREAFAFAEMSPFPSAAELLKDVTDEVVSCER